MEYKGTLWGFPVYVTDEVPLPEPGAIIFGRLPTVEEVREAGSFEAAVEKMKDDFRRSTENQQPGQQD